MLKKTISFVLVFMMVLTMAIPINTFGSSKDYLGHWAEKTIQSWLDNSYVAGYPDGSFKPEGKVTRAEFVTMVNNVFGYTEKGEIDFSDVKSDDWFYSDVQKAYKAGYIKGVSETQFAPNAYLTREQAAIIVAKIMNLESNAAGTDIFTDNSKISNWAKEYVGASATAHIIKGYVEDNSFRPQNPIKRAEAIVTLDRAMSSSDLIIDEAGSAVENKTYRNIHITKSVGNGEVILKNVTVTGELLVEGGGENSIKIEDSSINKLTINKKDGKVRILLKGGTEVDLTSIISGAILEQQNLTGNGFVDVVVEDNANANQTVTINADIKELSFKAQIKVNVKTGIIESLVIEEAAEELIIDLGKDVQILSAVVNTKVAFTGNGTIENAYVNADGVSFERKPENTKLAPGIKDVEVKVPSTGGGSGSGSSKEEKEITSVANFNNIIVPYGTSVENIALSQKAVVTLEDNSVVELNIKWDTSKFDGNKPGTYELFGTIILKDGIVNNTNKKATIKVIVQDEVNENVPVTSVTLEYDEVELLTGDVITITAAILPINASNKGVTWQSTNTTVAAIVANGLSATITAKTTGSAIVKVISLEDKDIYDLMKLTVLDKTEFAQAIKVAEAAMSEYLNAGGLETDAVYELLLEAIESNNIDDIKAATAEIYEAIEELESEAAKEAALAEAKEAAEAAMSTYLNLGGLATDSVYGLLLEAIESNNTENIKATTAAIYEAIEELESEAAKAAALAEAKEKAEAAMSTYLNVGGLATDSVYGLLIEAIESNNIENIKIATEAINDAIEELESEAAKAAALAEAKEKAEAAMSTYLNVGGLATDSVYGLLIEAIESNNIENIIAATEAIYDAMAELESEAAKAAALAQAKEAAEAAMLAYLDAGGLATDIVYVELLDAIESNNTENIKAATVVLNEALKNVDKISPVITLKGENTINLENGATYIDKGVTITDNKDTDLVATVTYTKDGQPVDRIYTLIPGTYLIHYNVSDEAGNVAIEVTREVIVAEPKDTIAPVIKLNGKSIINLDAGATYVEEGVAITDNKDTDLVPIITYSKNGLSLDGIDTKISGTYVIRYNVSDKAGNKAVEVSRIVIVKDVTAPVITLNGNSTITITMGSVYKDLGATATDNADGEVAVTNDSASAVDTSKVGTYIITYTAVDKAGNIATITRTVIVTNKLSDNWSMITKTGYRLGANATEYTVVSKNQYSWTNISYFCEADISEGSNLKIISGYNNYDASKWRMATLSEQAAAAQAYFAKTQGYENYKVIGILVGDTFNMSTGEPTGALVMNGVKYHNPGDRPYFAILKDGTPAIRNSNVSLNDCESAVGGIEVILKDGKITTGPTDEYRKIMYSRAAIGIKADGTVVTMATHGFRIPESYGLTFVEVASSLKSMGCVDAIMLDGGGSAQWSSVHEGTDKLEVRNKPSDGYERSVSSSIILVSTAPSDGEFDHATIFPVNEVYTPNSSVTFTAVGVDSAGGPADIPVDIAWKLDDESYGTINGEGIFVSNGKTGEVKVKLLYRNKIVGTSTITIAAPDSITFDTNEISIGRGKESDLGLIVMYKQRDINYKSGDLVWLMSDSKLGIVNDETNIFTANKDTTVNGTITVCSAYDQSIQGSILVNVGQDPTVVFNFENVTTEDGTVIDSYEYWGADENGKIVGRKTGNDYLKNPTGKLTTLFYNRGGKESAEIVSRGDGHPVHSGTYSLKINYDMSKATGTEGANVGLTENLEIPGYPTGLGLWVYVPENTPNLWLRARLAIVEADGTDNVTQYDFTQEIKMAYPQRGSYGGLADVERGTWQFLVMDLSKYAGKKFKMLSGETIRLMWVPSSAVIADGVIASHGIYLPDGSRINQADCVGSIYVDDFVFIYGSINEDTKAPIVTSFTANSEDIREDITFNSNNINFKAMFKDENDEENMVNASGIDFDNVYTYVDGQLMEKAVVDKGGMIILDGIQLANGEHSIKLLICDLSGNERVVAYNFVVNGDDDYTTVDVNTSQTEAVLGGSVDLDIESNEISDIDSISMILKVDKKYKDLYKISGAEGFTVDTGSIKFNGINNTISFTVKRNVDAVNSGKGKIATISFNIPNNLKNGTYFTYSVESGKITYNSNYGKNNVPSFSGYKNQIPVVSPYFISSDILVEGMNEGYFYVKDTEDNIVNNVTLYFSDNSVIGTTDEAGKVLVPDSILQEATRFEVYAKDGSGNVSFSYVGQSYSAGGLKDSGKPAYIMNNASSNSFTTRNLSWVTNPVYSEPFAKVQISDSEAGVESGQTYEGTSKVYEFKGSVDAKGNYATRVNGAMVTGLTPGKKYYYRVGDGTNWSEVRSFTMPVNDNDINIFVLGDIQARDLTNITTILNTFKQDEKGFDLGIQTGDAVDAANHYGDWTEYMELLTGLKDDQVMLNTLGNHELTGEGTEEISPAMYNLTNSNHYSVDNGLVYVATIKHMSSMAEYEKSLKWLVQDAAKSNAKYKILTMHQPAYYTNESDPSNALLHKLLPAYVEQAGIDIVFSGHDHSYARTEEINSVVYYICGSSGEKSYPMTVNKDFKFVKATLNFSAIYLTINATNEAITVTTYDLIDGVPTIIDTYTKSNAN